jgi:hypothetical protein
MLTNTIMMIWVFWDMTPCHSLHNILKLWNFRKHSSSDTASYPRRPESSEVTLSNTEGIVLIIQCMVFLWHFGPIPGHGLPLWGFVITLIGNTTLCRIPLDEWSAQCWGLYLTAHKHSQQTTSMLPSGIRTHNPSRRVAADLCLRLRGHCNRH